MERMPRTIMIKMASLRSAKKSKIKDQRFFLFEYSSFR